MKNLKFLPTALIVSSALVFTSCASSDSSIASESDSTSGETAEEAAMTSAELDEIIATQELAVTSTYLTPRDETFASLYPDMIQAVVKNNTDTDIKNIEVSFAAWDENNLPVKIEGQFDLTNGAYIKTVKCPDVNLIPDAEYGEDTGYKLNDSNTVSTIKAIVVQAEDFDGNTWENPYYDDFTELYEGKKLQ